MKRLNLFMSLVCIGLAMALVGLFLYDMLERHEVNLSSILYFVGALLASREFWRRAKLPLQTKTMGSVDVESSGQSTVNEVKPEALENQSTRIAKNSSRRIFSIVGILFFMLSMWMVALFLYALFEEHEFAPFRLFAAVCLCLASFAFTRQAKSLTKRDSQ